MPYFPPPGHAQGLKKIMDAIFKKPGSVQQQASAAFPLNSPRSARKKYFKRYLTEDEEEKFRNLLASKAPQKKKGKRSRTPPPDKRIPLEDAAEFLAELLRARDPAGRAMSVQQILKQFSLRDKKTRAKLRESFGVSEPRPSKTGRPLRQRDPRTGKRLNRKGGANEPASVAYSMSQNPDAELTYEILESLIRNYRKDPTPYIRSRDLLK
jgi:hypothetical protein